MAKGLAAVRAQKCPRVRIVPQSMWRPQARQRSGLYRSFDRGFGNAAELCEQEMAAQNDRGERIGCRHDMEKLDECYLNGTRPNDADN